jgi:hypothetical protein
MEWEYTSVRLDERDLICWHLQYRARLRLTPSAPRRLAFDSRGACCCIASPRGACGLRSSGCSLLGARQGGEQAQRIQHGQAEAGRVGRALLAGRRRSGLIVYSCSRTVHVHVQVNKSDDHR